MPHLSLTTWSLHRELGPLRWNYWDEKEQTQKVEIQEQPENCTLLELPYELASQNYQSLEVCHFHFPTTDSQYLAELRKSFEESGISFHSLLVDYGDISTKDNVRRKSDTEFIRSWIDVAEEVGAKMVRVVGGEADPEDSESLAIAKQTFRELTEYAKDKKVSVITENFRELTSKVENCLQLLEACEGKTGITVDFGNFKMKDKYESIKKLMPYAVSIHAKANYDENGVIDVDEYKKCLELVMNSGYSGPITLVYDGPWNLWKGIQQIKDIVQPYCR